MRNIHGLRVVEQDSTPFESREEFIAIGSYRLKVEPYIKTAYERFKARKKYSRGTDSVYALLTDGLIVNGFLSPVTTQEVTEGDALIITADIHAEVRRCITGRRDAGFSANAQAVLEEVVRLGVISFLGRGCQMLEESREIMERAKGEIK